MIGDKQALDAGDIEAGIRATEGLRLIDGTPVPKQFAELAPGKIAPPKLLAILREYRLDLLW